MEEKQVGLNLGELVSNIQDLVKTVQGIVVEKKEKPRINALALYLLKKADMAEGIRDVNGVVLTKTEVDEITLDYTRTRTLSEEQAKIFLNCIYDKSAYLKRFNPRTVDKLVTPVEAKAITQENLYSNEQAGSAVTPNERILHNFGINLELKHMQLYFPIYLQTVIDNLYKAGWENEVLNDVLISLSNDILLIVLKGLGGNYASTKEFYDLNKGIIPILQQANGQTTNSNGSVKVYGFLAKYLTPQKINGVGATGANYTPANVQTLMGKMYKAMPIQFRTDPNNEWMMSQEDADTYGDSRADMSAMTSTIREMNLTNGTIPNFKGFPLVPYPGWIGINEVHHKDSTLKGCIVFGNPKHIDIASDQTSFRKSLMFDDFGAKGPVFKHGYNVYLDIQPIAHNSFVIAFSGAKVETPYFVTEDGNKNGMSGNIEETSANTYNNGGANLDVVPYCDTLGARIIKATATLAGATTLAEALLVAGAVEVTEGEKITLSADTYFRAYHTNGWLTASTQIFFDKAL